MALTNLSLLTTLPIEPWCSPDNLSCSRQGNFAAVSQRAFYSFSLPRSNFSADTAESAIFRVYEDLNCGSVSLTQQQVLR